MKTNPQLKKFAKYNLVGDALIFLGMAVFGCSMLFGVGTVLFMPGLVSMFVLTLGGIGLNGWAEKKYDDDNVLYDEKIGSKMLCRLFWGCLKVDVVALFAALIYTTILLLSTLISLAVPGMITGVASLLAAPVLLVASVVALVAVIATGLQMAALAMYLHRENMASPKLTPTSKDPVKVFKTPEQLAEITKNNAEQDQANRKALFAYSSPAAQRRCESEYTANRNRAERLNRTDILYPQPSGTSSTEGDRSLPTNFDAIC